MVILSTGGLRAMHLINLKVEFVVESDTDIYGHN
jgi:hypothetical protein